MVPTQIDRDDGFLEGFVPHIAVADLLAPNSVWFDKRLSSTSSFSSASQLPIIPLCLFLIHDDTISQIGYQHNAKSA